MLEIVTDEEEIFQPATNMFIPIPSCVITLEHSLISIAKWESKWHIPYLSDTKRSDKQELDYIRCMVVGTVKDDRVFELLSRKNIKKISDYIDNPMTATTFSKTNAQQHKREVVTAETLYYRMFSNNIPMECQKWHLNRLLTLIRVCDLYNSPKQKMSKTQTAAWNAEQNAARRAKYNTRG